MPRRFTALMSDGVSGAKRFLTGQTGFVLTTLGGVGLAVASLPRESLPFAEVPWQPWCAVAGILAVVIGVIAQLKLEPTYADLVRRQEQHEKRATQTADALQKSLSSILTRIAVHCDINRSHQRISIYCEVNEKFVLLARYSLNQRLATPGRRTYPVDQGAIGEAWEKGRSTRWNWPEDRTEWNAAVTRESGIDADVVHNLAMQARSLVATRLTHAGQHVGILVMESEEARGIRLKQLAAADESLLLESATEIMFSAHPHFPEVYRQLHDA